MHGVREEHKDGSVQVYSVQAFIPKDPAALGLTIFAFNKGKFNSKTLNELLSLGPTFVIMKVYWTLSWDIFNNSSFSCDENCSPFSLVWCCFSICMWVRNETEQLMDDDGDMAEMYLTEKKLRAIDGDQSIAGYSSIGAGMSVSAPVSPVSSPTETQRLEKSLSIARSRHESMKSSESATENIEELEMLLEAYFVVIDSTLNKLTSLKEYIDDTEDFINIQLDNVRNQLIQFELLLTTATFVVAIFGVVAGIFGMNFSISLFDEPEAFKWVLLITGACGIFIFCTFLWFFRHRRLMPL
ncbi:magnesium transporter MRS2-B-like [Nymphaea colorata]|nr:magnesium transporter MRS2-B-like [Nymphaea colorata]